MGTIASVLQWTCSNSNCRYINPTESLKCINCGNIRRIKIPAYLASPDEYDDECDECDGIDSPTDAATINSTIQRTKTTKHSDLCDETLPGYVEINSNGYNILFSHTWIFHTLVLHLNSISQMCIMLTRIDLLSSALIILCKSEQKMNKFLPYQLVWRAYDSIHPRLSTHTPHTAHTLNPSLRVLTLRIAPPLEICVFVCTYWCVFAKLLFTICIVVGKTQQTMKNMWIYEDRVFSEAPFQRMHIYYTRYRTT